MDGRRQLVRWLVTGLTCVMLASALAAPQYLPAPLERTVDAAVTGAAYVWLWVLNKPA